MSAPGGILMAKIIMPDEGPVPAARRSSSPKAASAPRGRRRSPRARSRTKSCRWSLEGDHKAANIIEAAAQGAQTGVKLAVAVGAMVLAFVALVALANGLLGWAGGLFGYPQLSFPGRARDRVRAGDVPARHPVGRGAVAGGLFGTKVVLNEFVAFIDLGAIEPGTISARTRRSSPSPCAASPTSARSRSSWRSPAGLAPNQRPLIARLGLKGARRGLAGQLMSAALAGLFLSL
jgi:CNT family concentrative nucleoside transporter